MDGNTAPQSYSPQEFIKLGEQIYSEKKEELERTHYGEYAIIEVDSKDVIVNQDKTTALQEAQKKHPGKLFFIAQIGNLKPQSSVDEVKHYAMPF